MTTQPQHHSAHQLRKPKGTRDGGEWVEMPKNAVSTLSLVTEEDRSARRDSLLSDDFVPATIASSAAPASSTRNIEQWWDNSFLQGEYTARGGVPRFPDDYHAESKGAAGNSLSGSRRAYRRVYHHPQIGDVRLPAVSAIRSYLSHENPCVDVPVAYFDGEHHVQGMVRVSKNGDGYIEATMLGGRGIRDTIVAEQVAGLVDRRRPRFESVNDLLSRRDTRRRAYGIAQAANVNNSSFITGVNFNASTETILVEMGDRAYTYHGSREDFEALTSGESMGKSYNDLKKRSEATSKMLRCDKCGRFKNDTHTCPPRPEYSHDSAVYQQRMAALDSVLSSSTRPVFQSLEAPARGQNTGWTRTAVSTVLHRRGVASDERGPVRLEGVSAFEAAKVGEMAPKATTRASMRQMNFYASNLDGTLAGFVSPPSHNDDVILNEVHFRDSLAEKQLKARMPARDVLRGIARRRNIVLPSNATLSTREDGSLALTVPPMEN